MVPGAPPMRPLYREPKDAPGWEARAKAHEDNKAGMLRFMAERKGLVAAKRAALVGGLFQKQIDAQQLMSSGSGPLACSGAACAWAARSPTPLHLHLHVHEQCWACAVLQAKKYVAGVEALKQEVAAEKAREKERLAAAGSMGYPGGAMPHGMGPLSPPGGRSSSRLQGAHHLGHHPGGPGAAFGGGAGAGHYTGAYGGAASLGIARSDYDERRIMGNLQVGACPCALLHGC